MLFVWIEGVDKSIKVTYAYSELLCIQIGTTWLYYQLRYFKKKDESKGIILD